MTEMVRTPETGAPQPDPFLTMQTALAIDGAFPPRDGGGPPNIVLGMIHSLAFSYPPFGTPPCAGQLMPIAQYTKLFSILGTSFGGNGATTFALPDLRNMIAVGGTMIGQQQAYALACTAMIAATPPGQASYPMVGMVAMFGGNYAPDGWLVADGSTLPIAQYVPLFEAIGTTYGGDGVSTFCLPNLTTIEDPDYTGLAPMGAGRCPGLPSVALGEVVPPYGFGLNYLISLTGVFPPRGGNGSFPPTDPIMGEMVAFTGASTPAGWALADGSLLAIADNQPLFALLGTTYGGDGQTDFALPDLRGRVVMGANN